MEDSICEIVRKAEQNYVYGTTTIGKYVNWSMHDTIETIDAYLNSKHISGKTDSQGREKPFFNIVTGATNIWYRATDLDRKDISVASDKSSNVALAFVATVHLQEWMKRARFGVFLNLWGRSLARYGSSVVKFVQRNGELIATVVPWNRLIVDPIDFDALPRIEKFFKTEAQLSKMIKDNGYDKDKVESLCKAVKARQTLDGMNQDNQSNFIELYEVHGRLPKSLYLSSKGKKSTDEDDEIYFQQMHVVSFVDTGTQDQSGNKIYEDFTLFSGREKKDPYMITHLIQEDGRTLSIGAVEYLFDAQWMQNHTIKNQKDILDLSSKLIFQTADATFVGRNVLSAIESGDIMIHKDNMPLTQINNSKADIVALQNFGQQWQILGREITSTPEALRGETLPSGTPYALGALLSENAGSLFEIMTENKALAVEDMLREHIIPFIKTQMDTSDEITATLEEHDIMKLDSMYVPREAVRRFNRNAITEILNGGRPSPYDPIMGEQNVKADLATLGNQRFFKPSDIKTVTWKKALEDLEWNLDINISGEASDQKATLETLSTAFQTIVSLAGRPMTPDERLIFNKIMSKTGTVSPLELSTSSSQPQPVQTAAAGGAGGGLPANPVTS